ncbi:hypothetical protein DM860_006952 [Cuscuta australis]|uniref:Pentacotripeptide-repeat region of PRORP domain-containing protein n=1 Tax=Cuscuta australis TaxID=267555 RepID=A0A328E6U1_9ASTE|nr:hypothetical protein DM860_006952 [Cuscuta australis]
MTKLALNSLLSPPKLHKSLRASVWPKMESKRSVLSSAFFFFNKFSRRRLSVSPSPLMPGKMAAETGTSSPSSLSSLRSFHSIPQIVSSSDQNHVNSGYDISSVHDLDHAHVLFDQMLSSRPLPCIILFNRLLSRIVKMKHYWAVVSIFKEMLIRGIPVDTYTLNILIDAFCRSNRVDCGFCVIGMFFKSGIGFSAVTYNTLIKTLCLNDKIAEAVELFRMFVRDNSCEVDNLTSVLQGLFLVGQFDDALNIFQNMQLSGHAPNFHTYCVLLTGLCDNGHIGKAMSVYSKLSSNESGSHVFGSIIIDGLCKMGLLNIARGILSNLFFKGQYLNKYTYTAMMNGLCQGGFVHKALELLRRMGEIGCEPDSITYNVILQEFVRAKKLDEILLPNA